MDWETMTDLDRSKGMCSDPNFVGNRDGAGGGVGGWRGACLRLSLSTTDTEKKRNFQGEFRKCKQ